ncbi:MAG: hypothetical protein WCZ90_11710 [Melioribacteraceae bacterium]
MILASIDLGSNSVILLLIEFNPAEGTFKILKEVFTTPRISEDITNIKVISSAAILRLEKELDQFEEIISKFNCEIILVSATNAFRIANNGRQVKNDIEIKYEWKVSILDGKEEARLTFLGTLFPSFVDTNSILIDIGGGSTEIIYGNIGQIKFLESLQLGVVSLKELFSNNNGIPPNRISEIQSYIHHQFSSIKIDIPFDINALAVAGTPTTISAIVQNLQSYSVNLIDGSELQLDQIINVRFQIQNLNSLEIGQMFGSVVYGREDLLLSGCLILEGFMKYFEIDKITVSTKGLRYGAVYNYLINKKFYRIKN